MDITAEILCHKTLHGAVCNWKGPRTGVAKVYGDVIAESLQNERIRTGDVFTLGRLRFRIVQWPMMNLGGAYMDAAAVMLESPQAELYWLYREKAEKIVRFIANCEMRLVAAYRGLRLMPSPEGELLRLTSRLADLLL